MSISSRSILLLLITTNIISPAFKPTPPTRAFKATAVTHMFKATAPKRFVLEAVTGWAAANGAGAVIAGWWATIFGTGAATAAAAGTTAQIAAVVTGTAIVGGVIANAVSGSETTGAVLGATSEERRETKKKSAKQIAREARQEKLAKKTPDDPNNKPQKGPDGVMRYPDGTSLFEREEAIRKTKQYMQECSVAEDIAEKRALEASINKPTYKNGIIVDNPKHHINSSGNIGRYVDRAQVALDNAIKVPDTSYLVTAHEGKWVMFQPDNLVIHGMKRFHAYEVFEYADLPQAAKNALYESGVTRNLANGKLSNWFTELFFSRK